jgi:hypothetical protein
MSKDPAFLFYSSDWITGTMTMSFEDRGKYITLLCLLHQQGRMNEETIRFLVGSVSDKLKTKFDIDAEGMWYNSRLDAEIQKRAQFAESRRSNGKLGGRPPKEEPKRNLKETKEEPIGYASENLPENENKDVNKNTIRNEEGVEDAEVLVWPTFDDFWNLYDKKVDRKVCEPKWEKLKHDDKEKIMSFIPKYIESQPDKKFRKDPETFLNRGAWENEIIESYGKQYSKTTQSFTREDAVKLAATRDY